MRPRRPTVPALALACCVAGLALAACGKGPSPPPAAAGAASAPGEAGIAVTTALASQRALDISLNATGTATAVASVDIKPQVSGVVTAVHVREGQAVRAGERLFSLDTRADQANVAKTRAQLAKDQAALADARRQLARAQELLAQNFISRGAVDTNQATVEGLQATLQADQAALQAAQVALSFGEVRAASEGRIGAVPVYVGSAVQANSTTMTTLTRIDPIDVSFALPQSSLPDLLSLLTSGQGLVRARLPDGQTTLEGRLGFVDNAVDPATGTVKVKARFANADSRLWPGAFVNVELRVRTLPEAVVVPTVSVIQGPRGPIVYLVQQRKAVAQPVKVLSVQGEVTAVDGVAAGQRVVVEGRQNLRPGVTVSEHAQEPARTGPAAARPKAAS